jgi:UrcA family protein
MNTLNHSNLTAMTLAFALLTGSAQLMADEPSAKINIRHVDFNNPQEVSELYGRIQQSARMVCNDASGVWDGQRTQTFNRCYEASVDQAVRDINRYELTAVHQGNTGQFASQ